MAFPAGIGESAGESAPDALDWQGLPVRCQDCPHEDIQAQGRCDLGKACVADRRGKRIDGFFARNPDLAGRYLAHPYFEVRTLAAKHASLFLIGPLLADPEPEVRAMAVMRLPPGRVRVLRTDPDRRVRMAVAQRLEGGDLLSMMADEDYYPTFPK